MTIFDSVKAALRVSTTNAGISGEINDIVAAAQADLRGVGVCIADVQPAAADVTDPLIRRAVILYAKAHFGFADDQEKYLRTYEALKVFLSLTDDYTEDAP